MESVVPCAARNGIRPSIQTDLKTKTKKKRNGIRPILIDMDLKTDTERGNGISVNSEWNEAKFLYREGN